MQALSIYAFNVKLILLQRYSEAATHDEDNLSNSQHLQIC